MLPRMTAFNGKGCEHSDSGFHVPVLHFTKIKRGAKHHLAVMDISKNAVVFAWYRLDGKPGVGIHQHQRLQQDRRGKFFISRGNKVYVTKS